MKLALLLPMLSLAACATSPANQRAACREDVLARFVDQPASVDTSAQMIKASGARAFRWAGPGVSMTMDYRPDRVTAFLNVGLNRIVRVSCG